jgi:hypothetical protein
MGTGAGGHVKPRTPVIGHQRGYIFRHNPKRLFPEIPVVAGF